MANGASRLFEVMKNTGESTNNMPSQVVSLTIKSVNPLILVRDDRLEIPAEFCIIYKNLNINSFRVGDIVTAIVLNNGQQYLILSNDTAEEQGANYEDLSNKPSINNVELIGNKTSSDLDLDDYNNMNNKPKINGVELSGNKTSDDLLIVSKTELQTIVQEMMTTLNSKVNKSGDTLTGELNFNNKNDYAVFRKTRTINGVDYNANFGIGADLSARIEFQDANRVNLGQLEVRSDGHIWNGQNNKKLGEVANLTWGTSLTFSLDVGRHALVMVNHTDCLMLWMAGNEILNTVRLLGTSVQATSSGTTVTIKYSDNRKFTGNAIIT